VMPSESRLNIHMSAIRRRVGQRLRASANTAHFPLAAEVERAGEAHPFLVALTLLVWMHSSVSWRVKSSDRM